MTINRALLAAAIVLLTGSVAPAFAYDNYDRHARDHAEHTATHRGVARSHERAHDEGFESRREHRKYHGAVRRAHRDFHEDHPGTRHDRFGWRRY